MKRKFYLLSLIIPVSMAISFTLRGAASYLTLIFAFGLLPLLELFLPVMDSNLTPQVEEAYKTDKFFDLLLWSMLPLQILLLIYFCYILSTQELQTSELIGLVSAMGIGCGVIGINVAHELGHRSNRIEQTMAKILLSTSLYWHFFIEHNKGHHKNVSTPLDPESSRLNESLYAFWVRSIKDSFVSAFKIDRSEMIKAIILQLILVLGIFLTWGARSGWGFLASALIGIILLESVNYIEHYGLTRKEIAPNKYEKVRPVHSWNANHPISRTVLFDLSRHSDHHAFVNRRFQLLRHHDESPQLPTGYPGMIVLALFPPLWFRVMNKRINF